MAQRGTPDRPVGEDLLRTIGEHVLNRATVRADARGVSAQALPLGDGAAAAAIATAADAEGVDTIVMGTRGLRQIEAVAFGSVSQAGLPSCGVHLRRGALSGSSLLAAPGTVQVPG